MSKHTPAPWRVSANQVGAVVADSPQAVDHSHYKGFDCKDYYGGYLIAESVVLEANAQLIAAAPELLEALKDMLSDRAMLSEATIQNAQRAISKAECRA